MAGTTGTMVCPRCGQSLPADAQNCDRCNWTREEGKLETAEGKASDAVAVLLSIIPLQSRLRASVPVFFFST